MSLHQSPDATGNESWPEYYYDIEEECQFQELPHARWILPTLYSIFFLVGFLGNVVVIAMVSKRTSRRSDIFILNLAVSDLLFVFTLPLWASSSARSGYWPFGVYLCKASGFVIAVNRCASSFLMAVMSVDRYVTVIKGKKMHPLRTRSYSLAACCTVWAISILVGCPSLVSRDLDSNNFACVDSYQWLFTIQYKMVLTFLTFVLPFAVVLFCYCSMAKYLWNYFGKQVRAMTSTGKPQRGHSWLRIVLCVVGAFCLSWLPFNALNTVLVIHNLLETNMTCSTEVFIGQALSVAAALAFANSCSNPLIYALLDSGFRRRARRCLPGLFLTCCSALHIPTWTVPITITSMESTTPTLTTDDHASQPRVWNRLMQTVLRKICRQQPGT
ncbi:probable G-protein coupled receptor 25 [Bufo bufo]|uniref:probable G-protein coupled receptor 25 n=1 Tax=Bufo bufo TaxID=8384 RepID=UPI001ABE8D39|nr:probable G-protein coupled receptor 25 [Bufo bufo]